MEIVLSGTSGKELSKRVLVNKVFAKEFWKRVLDESSKLLIQSRYQLHLTLQILHIVLHSCETIAVVQIDVVLQSTHVVLQSTPVFASSCHEHLCSFVCRAA